jgi:hypothetical protein
MTILPAPARIGSLWQQRMDGLREYEVVRDGNVFGTSFVNNYLYTSEYEQARQQLGKFRKKYDGISLCEIFTGTEKISEAGVCFHITNEHELPVPAFDTERYQQDLLSDLTLVKGIGDATCHRLKTRGYTKITDLVCHPKYRANAYQVLEQLKRGNSLPIMDYVGSRHAKSHPLVLGAAGLHEPEDFMFLDIETMGLFSRPIILFGIGIIEHGRFFVHQYVVRDIEEELPALLATLGHLCGDNTGLVTFNGKSFDYPYLIDRLAYYGMNPETRVPHFDVLHFSRRRWKGKYPSLCLSSLEKEILGVSRQGDIPGQMVPEFYEDYLRTGNCGPLVPIIEHNRQDVVSLARLFFHLLGESYGC